MKFKTNSILKAILIIQFAFNLFAIEELPFIKRITCNKHLTGLGMQEEIIYNVPDWMDEALHNAPHLIGISRSKLYAFGQIFYA